MVCRSPIRSNQAFSLANTVQDEEDLHSRSREHLKRLCSGTIYLPTNTALRWPPNGASYNGQLIAHPSTPTSSLVATSDGFSPVILLGDMNQPTCSGCGIPIEDRFLLKVMEQTWHEHCLQCSVCGMQLLGSCFYRNGRFYCRLDYQRMFATKCTNCGEAISSSELVMRARGSVYHLHCFNCCICRRHLQKGEEYVLHNNQLFCKHDYHNVSQIQEASDTGPGPGTLHHPPMTASGVLLQGAYSELFHMQPAQLHPMPQPRPTFRRGEQMPTFGFHAPAPKRPRTILTATQRHLFKSIFEQNPKPCRKVRERLSQDTGLSVRVVQVWFQNQRAKVKKTERKKEGRSESASSVPSGAEGSPAKSDDPKPEVVTSSEGSSGDLTAQADSPLSLHLQSPLTRASQSMTSISDASTGIAMGRGVAMPQQSLGGHVVEASRVEETRTLHSSDDPLQMLHSMQSHYFDQS